MKTTKQYVKVTLNGEVNYYTLKGYEEFRLTLSTGDFAVHKALKVKNLPRKVSQWSVIDENDVNPRLLYPTLDSIVEGYDDEDTSAEEYSKSEDSPLAEYVASFGYGEGDISGMINNAELSDDVKTALKAYLKQHGRESTLDLLERYSTLDRCNIYLRDGEIYSATIGEQEHQVRKELSAAFQTLTPEEKDYVIKHTKAGIFSSSRNSGEFIYTSDDYHRWVMIADEESLAEELSVKEEE